MEKTKTEEVTIHREVYDLEDFVSPRAGVKEFSTWLREYVEGSGEAVWIPHDPGGNKMGKPFRIPVTPGSDSFILEKQYNSNE